MRPSLTCVGQQLCLYTKINAFKSQTRVLKGNQFVSSGTYCKRICKRTGEVETDAKNYSCERNSIHQPCYYAHNRESLVTVCNQHEQQ